MNIIVAQGRHSVMWNFLYVNHTLLSLYNRCRPTCSVDLQPKIDKAKAKSRSLALRTRSLLQLQGQGVKGKSECKTTKRNGSTGPQTTTYIP